MHYVEDRGLAILDRIVEAVKNDLPLLLVGGPCLDEWMKWAMAHDIDESVIGYLNYRAEALYQEPKNVQDEFSNFPSPRSWARISRLVRCGMADLEYVKGCVGEGAAVEFGAYMRDRNEMPDIGKLLSGELHWDPVKTRAKLSVVWAVTAALGDRVVRDQGLLEPAAAVLMRIQPEIASLFMSMLMNSPVKGVMKLMLGSKGLSGWLRRHQKLIARAISAAA